MSREGGAGGRALMVVPCSWRRSAAGRGGAEEDGGRWRRRTSADVVECAGEGIIFFVAVVQDRKK